MDEFEVTFNSNVKLDKDVYRKGDAAIVNDVICAELKTKGVITDNIEPIKPKTLNEMTLPELKEYATQNGIDLGEAKKKEDILAVIQSAENDNEDPPEE